MDCQDYPMVEFYFKSWWCGHCTHCSWVCIWLSSLRTMLPRCICAHCRAYPLLFLCVHTTPVHFALHVTHLYLHLRSRCAVSFCWSCPPWPWLCPPLCVFPGIFHLPSWAITVAALIIGIMLTLVPLCSRKGLTLAAIYADWLDRPGIPKVWGVLLAVTQILWLLDMDSVMILKTYV